MMRSLGTPCCASLRVSCAAGSPSSPLMSTCGKGAGDGVGGGDGVRWAGAGSQAGH